MDEIAKKSAAASVGAFITSFVVPLEVVKTRLQVQAPAVVHAPPAVQKCPYYSFSNGLMDTMLPKQRLLTQCKCSPQQIFSPPKPDSTLFTMARIVRLEGPLALYAGLPPTLLTAIPSTAVYFTSYELLLKRLKTTFPEQNHGLLAMASGSTARAAAATIFSPFELIRVQMQAVANAHPFATYVWQVWQGGARQLFAGLGATLARDIPFSAFYWFGIETSKEYLTDRVPIADPQRRRVSVAFISGVLAGVLATVITHPFDVIKTRSQLVVFSKDMAPAPSIRQLLRQMWASEGARGMAAGLAPRIVKVAPACAIMISSYEATKQVFNVD
ncbi:hypothetical protein PHYSODRAFT_315024 [Phytophthora sojae]|uniref:Mitochondrial Carrier (MC) Family n=1 Tax=Phytophthora sojae (strain P6497) TaxID=1094619 RepID=G4ZDJ7_PHYSP|nr:hypothetical protein PHYSODRAFT_315024 [Phytophthora sojae]EGZ17847.1 hypothetical protein PHYSODRAFT_315024 [Phytophthora sojae]|eukprot:XP_009526905.1 hypothetical protein PHYSODRAFT_315024 [Phytophthora sojae]